MTAESRAHALNDAAGPQARGGAVGAGAVLAPRIGRGDVVDVACTAQAYMTDALLLYLALQLEFLVERHHGSLLGDVSVACTAAAGVEVGGGRWQRHRICRDPARGRRCWCAEVVARAAAA